MELYFNCQCLLYLIIVSMSGTPSSQSNWLNLRHLLKEDGKYSSLFFQPPTGETFFGGLSGYHRECSALSVIRCWWTKTFSVYDSQSDLRVRRIGNSPRAPWGQYLFSPSHWIWMPLCMLAPLTWVPQFGKLICTGGLSLSWVTVGYTDAGNKT